MKIKLLSILIFITATFMLIQCASEAAPGGGPPDKTAPSLINVNIFSGATQVPPEQEIVFYFSENLNPDLIEKSVTIFPLTENIASVRSKGKNLIIKPTGSWDPELVYTLILGKNISDLRNNSLPEPIQFSFTSGDHMPENKISGRVMGLDENSNAVICISRQYSDPDSIIMYPEYYTQNGADGIFTFEHLPADEFHIGGYIDLDNSNNYKASFDGMCIPSQTTVIPDTSETVLLMQAVNENFLPAQTIKAENIQPDHSEITFSKSIAAWNPKQCFSLNSILVDSLIVNENQCILYHAPIDDDTLQLHMNGLVDLLGIPVPDSIFNIPVTAWVDSFFHFENMGDLLRISPDPVVDKVTALYQTSTDTLNIELLRSIPGFYQKPTSTTKRRGTCLIELPFVTEYVLSDSTYAVSLNLEPGPEYGAVFGSLDSEDIPNLRLMLVNKDKIFETTIEEPDFMFSKVLPGSYTLSYYIDRNNNGRRDLGQPAPFIKPEFLYTLDTEIGVRARWDTELEEAYKIVVENDK